MQKIGLTGVTGHLGSGVYKRLTEHGIQTKLLMRQEHKAFTENEVVIGDLSDVEKLNTFAKGCTAVIHCAGLVWPKHGLNPEVTKTNLAGTKLLVEACKSSGVAHFLYVSSIHSMDAPEKDAGFDESASLTLDKYRPYDFSKAEVERYLLNQDGIQITVINPTAIIGPGDKNLRAMNQLFYRMFSGKLPFITAGGYYVIDVRTVAQALVNSVLLGKSGKYILGGKYYSIKELVEIYGAVNGMNAKKRIMSPSYMHFVANLVKPVEFIMKKPFPLNKYAVDTLLNAHPNIVSNHAIQDLELTDIPIEKTMKDLHSWFKNGINDY